MQTGSLTTCKISMKWQAKTDLYNPSNLRLLWCFPDTFITDPYSCLPAGIVEFKCPYSKRELPLIDAYLDPKFYCFLQ